MPLPNAPPPPACRALLARQAAGFALAGRGAGPLLPALRALTTAELLTAPPGRAAELHAVLTALTAAAEAAVRRRAGWLKVELPPGPLPAAAPARLVQAAVLSVWRGALQSGASALVRGRADASSMWLALRGGRPGAAPALLAALARQGGGVLLQTARPPFAAVLRLPRAAGKTNPAPAAEDLLRDRYSLLYLYLDGFCAGPDD